MNRKARHVLFDTMLASLTAALMFSIGLSVSPKSANAFEAGTMITGYSCQGTDVCHEGESPCCKNNPLIPVGQGSCYTNCPAT